MIYLVIDELARCPVYAFTNEQAANDYIKEQKLQGCIMELPCNFHWKDL